MEPKTLLFLIFFAVQCIVRFEAAPVLECTDEPDIIEFIFYHNLYMGLVPILVTDNRNSAEIENAIINFFSYVPGVTIILKVNVKRGSNKVVARYLYQSPATPIYPFVTLMKNHKLIMAKVVGYNEQNLLGLLHKADSNIYISPFSNLSIDLLDKIDKYHKYFIREVDGVVRNNITTAVTGANTLPVMPQQAVNSNFQLGGSSNTYAPASVYGQGGYRRESDGYTLSGLPFSGFGAWDNLLYPTNMPATTYVPEQKRRRMVSTTPSLPSNSVDTSWNNYQPVTSTTLSANSVSENYVLKKLSTKSEDDILENYFGKFLRE